MKASRIYLLFPVLFILPAACGRNEGEIRASGTIEATEVRIAAKQGGEIVELAVAEGGRVAAGDLLARIDATTPELELKQAQSVWEQADAQLQLLLQGARLEDIQQAEEGLTQAGENLKLAQEDARRMQELFRSDSVTKKQKDDAEARLILAESQHNAARLALKKVQNLARPEELRAMRARREQARISVKLLEKAIADCRLASPIAGVVTHKLMEQGELAARGAILFSLANLSRVELTIYVPEPDLADIRLGQPARIIIDSRRDGAFKGKVTRIASEAEFTPKNVQTREERIKLVYAVTLSIDNPEERLKPGMPADAVLRRGEGPDGG